MKKLLLLLILLCPLAGKAEVTLHPLFTSHMMLQRDQPVRIWGWADTGERVEVRFNGQAKSTKADRTGKWTVTLNPMSHGGPHTLTVQGKGNTIVLADILVGDVWVCSGQSNMEWTVANTANAAKEIAAADYPMIRSFNVVKGISTTPRDEFDGEWTVCSPATVADYTAVGYFFARKLFRETGIPIGIIHSSWGGTDIETWTSPEAFATLPAEYSERYKNVQITGDFETFADRNAANKKRYEEALANDPGQTGQWYAAAAGLDGWKPVAVPGLWSQTGPGAVDGVVWYASDIDLPAAAAGQKAEIHLGMVDDQDITWVNGQRIGESWGYSSRRNYTIPAGLLKEGRNRIAIRIYDTGGDGGITARPEDLFLRVAGTDYPLAGEWKYREAVTNVEYDYVEISPNMYPSLLYNAMIHPMTAFAIRGAIWYQGENNAAQALHYRTLFPLMINDWRAKWGREFPFYWVQLANFRAKDTLPGESDWAELREAQTLTLSLPQTGQAVIADIGEANDIHPRNKQDVGLRLALHALHNDYGRADVACQSPTFRSLEIRGDKAIVTFDHAGAGLTVSNKYGYVEGFALAGADGKYHWAQAVVDGDKVTVRSDRVPAPVSVRYGWSDNPDINLYNSAGLPATPFRSH